MSDRNRLTNITEEALRKLAAAANAPIVRLTPVYEHGYAVGRAEERAACEERAAIECAEHELKARAEERRALVEKVEGMRKSQLSAEECAQSAYAYPNDLVVTHNQALDDLLTHLRSGSGPDDV